MPRERRVLVGGYFDWESPLHLGSHNLARAFAEAGWSVAYISTAISPVQALRDRREFRVRMARYSKDGLVPTAGLWAYMPFSLITPHNVPLLKSRVVHRNWQRFTVPNLVKHVHAYGFGAVDVLYLDNPLQMFWLDKVSHKSSIARITDRNSGYVGMAPELLAMEREMVHSVDLVAHSSVAVGEDLQTEGVSNLLYLPNGVDFDHFAHGERQMPPDLAGMSGPIATYIGTLDEWFDDETVNYAARQLPHVNFVIIGPLKQDGPVFDDLPNIHTLGARPFASLPGYLHNSQVGLLPRNTRTRRDLVEAMHPLKLYEYLACGLPVVATRWKELETIGSPAVLCDSKDAFARAISDALGDRSAAGERVAFARRASWSHRLDSMLQALDIATS